MNQDLPKDLTEIMIAQDFQDLTGQIIKKVIQLISEIENQLVMILKIFGVKLESSPSSDGFIRTSSQEAGGRGLRTIGGG